MMHLPPIAALRALAAAARHLSFTKAAAELNVTQSAVSHQIRHIEELWEIKLFDRFPRRLELTEAGEELAEIVDKFLGDITDKLESLKLGEGHTALRVDVIPSLAVKWLVPRLQQFRMQHEEIDVWLSTHHEEAVGDRGDFDLAIMIGDRNAPGYVSWELMHDYVIPVARPRFLEEHGKPETPEDLCKLPLLLKYKGMMSPGWRYWFDYVGVPKDVYQPALRDGTRFPDTHMAVQAAFEGQGVALARSAHVWDDLQTGRLLRVFDITCPSDVSVMLMCKSDRADRPAVVAFREWLMNVAAASQREWDAAEAKAAA